MVPRATMPPRSAWGVAAPPSSLRPAPPAAACAAGGHCCPAPVELHRPAPVHLRPLLWPVAPLRPHVGAKVGRVGGGRRLLSPPSCCPPPPPRPSPLQRRWGGGGQRCPGCRQCARYRGKNVADGARGPGLRRRGQCCQRVHQHRGGGGCSFPPNPFSPEPLRLSTRSIPPPHLLGHPLDPVGGGHYSPPRAMYSAPGRTVLVGWASGSRATGGGPPRPVLAACRNAWLAAAVVGPGAPATPAGPVKTPLPPATAAGCPACPRVQMCATPRCASRRCSHCGCRWTGHRRHGAGLASADGGWRGRATPTALGRCARTISHGRAAAPHPWRRRKYPASK